jgi:hypothetical protein
MINNPNHLTHITTLIAELELAVFTAQLSRTDRNKIVLKLLRLQHELTQK